MSKRYRRWKVMCGIWAVLCVTWMVIGLWQGEMYQVVMNLLISYWVWQKFSAERDLEELRTIVLPLFKQIEPQLPPEWEEEIRR